MKMNKKQTAQVKRFVLWLRRSQPTQKELEEAKNRLNKRTGLDVADHVVKSYIAVTIKAIEGQV